MQNMCRVPKVPSVNLRLIIVRNCTTPIRVMRTRTEHVLIPSTEHCFPKKKKEKTYVKSSTTAQWLK